MVAAQRNIVGMVFCNLNSSDAGIIMQKSTTDRKKIHPYFAIVSWLYSRWIFDLFL